MNKSERVSFDRKVLAFVKAKGTTNTRRVASALNVKWETADRSLKRLQKKLQVFYYPDMKLWSIFNDHNTTRTFATGQTVEKREIEEKATTTTLEISLSGDDLVRGEEGEYLEKEGFVCHPATKGKDVPRSFIRGHVGGQYLVEIATTGKMPESFILPDKETTGGWTVRKMSGNDCYFGHINFSYDPKTFRFHSMSNKKGNLEKLSVYVHPRYIYYKNNNFYAPIEFRKQVKDVLTVLEGYGWRFGAIYQKGTYHMAINDPVLASHVPKDHIELQNDPIKYDSSVKDGEGVCTEAEIYDDHPTSMAEMELMVELPQRFIGLDNKVKSLELRMVDVEKGLAILTGVVERNVDNTDRMINSIEDLTKVANFNTAILLGSQVPEDKQQYIPKTKEDAMYG